MDKVKIEEVKLNKVAEKGNRKYDDSIILRNVEIPTQELVTAISKSNPELLRDLLRRILSDVEKEKKEVDIPVTVTTDEVNETSTEKEMAPLKDTIKDILESRKMYKEEKISNLKETKNPFIGHEPKWMQLKKEEKIYNDIEIDELLKYEYIASVMMAIAPNEKIWKRYFSSINVLNNIKEYIAKKGLRATYNFALKLADRIESNDQDIFINKYTLIKGLYYIAPSRRQWIIALIGSIPDVGSMTDREILEAGLERYGLVHMMELAIFINELM